MGRRMSAKNYNKMLNSYHFFNTEADALAVARRDDELMLAAAHLDGDQLVALTHGLQHETALANIHAFRDARLFDETVARRGDEISRLLDLSRDDEHGRDLFAGLQL